MYGRDYFSLGIGDKQVIDNIDCSANDSSELTGFNAQFPADHKAPQPIGFRAPTESKS
jgi:hypothetical protein